MKEKNGWKPRIKGVPGNRGQTETLGDAEKRKKKKKNWITLRYISF